jgi:hypothetical protein
MTRTAMRITETGITVMRIMATMEAVAAPAEVAVINIFLRR